LLKTRQSFRITPIFFFLCWRYNPVWVLAFSAIFFHSVLSLLSFLHPLIPIVWISSSTSSIHLFFGLLVILLPIGFHSNILLGIIPPSIRITRPSQTTLLSINLTTSALPISSFSSWFFLIFQIPFSSCTGPKISLNIFRSNIFNCCHSASYKSYYVCTSYKFIQFMVLSGSPNSIFILYWVKDLP